MKHTAVMEEVTVEVTPAMKTRMIQENAHESMDAADRPDPRMKAMCLSQQRCGDFDSL